MSGEPANRLMAVWRRLIHFGRASAFDRELDEEISLHIEMQILADPNFLEKLECDAFYRFATRLAQGRVHFG